MLADERRHFGRIHLDAPIPARLGDARVSVIDLALNGAHIASEARFTPSAAAELKFEWNAKSVDLKCEVIRCTLYSFAKGPTEKSTYRTGLHIVESFGDSDRVLREVIATHVINALEEQKANARGVPPVGPYFYVEGKSDRYRRCEFNDDKWRRTETNRPEQPLSGFTISADVPIRYVDMLCETYQRSDEEGRRLTRILAQLSTSKAEGVPTRRYFP